MPVQFFQLIQRLLRQRNTVRAAHFHSFRRDTPCRLLTLKFIPCRQSELSGARGQKGKQMQRVFCRRLTGAFLYPQTGT